MMSTVNNRIKVPFSYRAILDLERRSRTSVLQNNFHNFYFISVSTLFVVLAFKRIYRSLQSSTSKVGTMYYDDVAANRM